MNSKFNSRTKMRKRCKSKRLRCKLTHDKLQLS